MYENETVKMRYHVLICANGYSNDCKYNDSMLGSVPTFLSSLINSFTLFYSLKKELLLSHFIKRKLRHRAGQAAGPVYPVCKWKSLDLDLRLSDSRVCAVPTTDILNFKPCGAERYCLL